MTKIVLGWTALIAIGLAILKLTDPSYVKLVLTAGIASLIVFFIFTKQGRISIYASQLVMSLMIVGNIS